MARFNELLVGRYNRFMQKLFSMKGPASLVTLSDELFAAFPLFNGAENRYLESWQRYGMSSQATGVAAVNSAIRLRNPAGSNIVAVVEKLVIQEGAADTIKFFNQTADANLAQSTAQGFGLDKRGPVSISNVLISAGTNVSGGQQWFADFLQASIRLDFIVFEDQEITILPGDQLDLRTSSLNVTFNAAALWRERFLEDSERT